MPNITNITPPRVPLLDPRTGLISRAWYRFFLDLFMLVGSGSNDTSITDLLVGPPPINDVLGELGIVYSQAQIASMMAQYDACCGQVQNQVATLPQLPALEPKIDAVAQSAAVQPVSAIESTVPRLKSDLDYLLLAPSYTPHVYAEAGVELLSTTAAIVLPTTPTLFKFPTTVYSDGFLYDSTTGELTFKQDGTYTLALQFNAEPSASNKAIYFYVEVNDGSGWVIRQYSGRTVRIPNAVESQVIIAASNYWPANWKVRIYVWGDSTITLRTTNVPGTTPGTVTVPAARFMLA